ncbi:MAG: GTPase Era [Halieaceae bacterium]|jgi:GTP-binding protein Era|nr:GTPase Era [Halieaceae bacterium]MDG1932257.1 GTPase Era [Luminiphilus sp.]MDG2037798.1 GTPase Era [Luminiphilus sp.]RZO81137.1 MAG: GTPase Era [Halieaceae bacterium]|tara:strand:+ start:2029 stop:2934 length:906 start_codon:yes stop_codon:yes gene_type:complete
MSEQRCGMIAIVGRPNVGKSTLLNHLLGQKLSITSRKPQTTRHQVLAVSTVDATQLIYVDTPGIHLGQSKAINRAMNKTAASALNDVDLVMFLCDRTKWTEEDEFVLDLVARQDNPVVLVMNKVDLLESQEMLLPFAEDLARRCAFSAVFPVSALRARGLEELTQHISSLVPAGPHLFPADQITDRSQRFLAAELVREKIVRQLGDELPYATAVEIESFSEDERGVLHIHALILVERDGQKKILVGEAGSRLKSIGTAARKDMERAFDSKVMLKLWVKVKSGWSDDARALKTLGLDPLGDA